MIIIQQFFSYQDGRKPIYSSYQNCVNWNIVQEILLPNYPFTLKMIKPKEYYCSCNSIEDLVMNVYIIFRMKGLIPETRNTEHSYMLAAEFLHFCN